MSGNVELNISAILATVLPERVIFPPLEPGETVIEGPVDNIVTIGRSTTAAPKRKRGRPRKVPDGNST